MKNHFALVIAFVIALAASAQGERLVVKNGDKGLYLEHTVLAKEGLYSIGRLYNVNPRHIAAYNKIDLNGGIDIDQVLQIPLTDTNFTQKSPSGTPVYYHVVSGDGLLKVSAEHNKVSLKSLRDWNDLSSDNIQEGSDLVIGFLISKEMVAYLANVRARNAELAKQNAEKKTEVVVADTKNQNPEITTDKPATKSEAINASEPIQNKKPEDTPKVINAVVKEDVKPTMTENGYFKSSFDQQVLARPITKTATLTSGVFKTTSGWQDAKYYMLIDGVTPGTIIKITNPDNNRSIYAKVLGEMNGIRQNQGLDVRISNAAASALQIADEEKFVVKVNY